MRRLPLILALLAAALVACAPAASAASSDLAFGKAVHLPKSDQGTEPRVAVSPDGRQYVTTNDDGSGNSIVFRSDDGGRTWAKTAADPNNGASPTIDVDVVSDRANRIISSELDLQAVSFITSYTDDGGKTWGQSQGGSQTGDTDRQWLAVGPDDPATKKPRVYLLYHNLASGTGQHNMFVVTSTDGGETFGVPVPVAQPPSQAYQDLQCSDSGGPSSLSVNPKTGRLYVVWGTRTAPALGGCGASIFGPFEVNVVGATRVWVGTSADNAPGSWETKLAVDDKGDNKIRGMQLAPGTLDNQGNLYVVYPESRNAYPDYNGAAVKYVALKPDLKPLAGPVTVAEGGGAGNVTPHIVAGDPGKLDVAYFHGVDRGKDLRPAWYTEVTQVRNGLSASPSLQTTRLSDIATYTGTASELMGACGEGPAEGVENGFACSRSTDVWGVALDARCNLTVTWPTRDNTAFAKRTNRLTQQPYGPAFDASPNEPGTFVAAQSAGPSLCGDPETAAGGLPPGAVPAGGDAGSTPGTGTGGTGTGAGCTDRIAPVTRVDRRRGLRITRGRIIVRGRASDRGCGPGGRGKVRQVGVAVARLQPGRPGRCFFLRSTGRFSSPTSCVHRSYRRARGTTRWSLNRRARLPRGTYRVTVRAFDTAGNKETTRTSGRNVRQRRVR